MGDVGQELALRLGRILRRLFRPDQLHGTFLDPAFQVVVGMLQRLVASFDLGEHRVESRDEQTHLVVGGALGPNGVVPLVGNMPRHGGQVQERRGDTPSAAWR